MIGIISDTHDNVDAIKKAVAIFKEKKVDFVLHLGDMAAAATISFFDGVKIKMLLGNVHSESEIMKEKVEAIGGEFLGDYHEMEYNGKKFALYHGTQKGMLGSLIRSQEFDFVLHGHDHTKRDDMVGKTRVINPGALYMAVGQKTVALLDNDDLEFVTIE